MNAVWPRLLQTRGGGKEHITHRKLVAGASMARFASIRQLSCGAVQVPLPPS